VLDVRAFLDATPLASSQLRRAVKQAGHHG
jgi:hypothetical protein